MIMEDKAIEEVNRLDALFRPTARTTGTSFYEGVDHETVDFDEFVHNRLAL